MNIMTHVIAVAFRDDTTASRVRSHLRTVEGLVIDDAAVIVKENDGSVRIAHELDRAVKRNALKGGVIGLLVGGLFAPSAGLVLGGLIGATVGRSQGLGIAHDEVKRLAEKLAAGESALVVRASPEQEAQLLASLAGFGGIPLTLDLSSASV